MKVLLASCSLSERWLPTVDRVNGHYPLGLAYLHSTLESLDHEVITLPLNDFPEYECFTQLLAAAEGLQPALIGLNVISDNRISTFHAIELLHEKFPEALLVIGGIHVSVMHKQMLEKYPYLVAVMGEGEQTLPALIDAHEAGTPFTDVAGLALVDGAGAVVQTAKAPLIRDVDALPFPNHGMFFTEERVHAHILTSRGCPFTCSFCVIDAFTHHKMRFRNPIKVVDEIEHVLKAHPQVHTITFVDDQFFADNQRVVDICDEIVRRGVRCRFMCQGRVRPVSAVMVQALEQAGFVSITLGLESGSEKILHDCHKMIKPKDIIEAVTLFSKTKINIRVLLIVGLPGETLQTVMETADLCQRLQALKYHLYTDQIQVLFVYPGAEIHDLFKKAGKIDDEFWLGDGDAPFFTAEYELEDLAMFKEILMTYLVAIRVLSPQGFLAQKHLLSHMIAHAYEFDSVHTRPLLLLVSVAAQRLLNEDRLNLDLQRDRPFEAGGTLDLFTLKPDALDPSRFMVSWETAQQDSIVPAIIRYAYLNGVESMTSLINSEIESLLTAAHEGNIPPEFEAIGASIFSEKYGVSDELFAQTQTVIHSFAEMES